MKTRWIVLLICIAAGLIFPVHGQKLMGLVVEKSADGKDQPLPGANVYWLGTTKGTSTKDNGIFSHSLQAQIDYQLAIRFDLRVAYRRVDVQTDYLTGRLNRPLIPKDRAFANLAYRTKSN